MAGSRIFVQEGVYDEFLTKFTAIAARLTSQTGDPFTQGTEHGPQVSKNQFDVCPFFFFFFPPMNCGLWFLKTPPFFFLSACDGLH